VNGVTVTASRQDLQQAFFNVVKNAVDAVSGNSGARTVSIVIERAGADARVTVSDNGPGMSEETLKTVFRQSVTTKSDGTGVGLMITRDLLMRNSGVIKLRNRNPGGLSAEITLPAA
jgi:C4-dicarboxylate-specific signal transduction histidine kinase